MKLTEAQKELMTQHDWEIVKGEDGQNCSWINLEPKDGEIFHIVTELFELTGEGNVDLLIVGYKEQDNHSVTFE
jgi:hypothetical protein